MVKRKSQETQEQLLAEFRGELGPELSERDKLGIDLSEDLLRREFVGHRTKTGSIKFTRKKKRVAAPQNGAAQ
jgi:hypothetical protein